MRGDVEHNKYDEQKTLRGLTFRVGMNRCIMYIVIAMLRCTLLAIFQETYSMVIQVESTSNAIRAYSCRVRQKGKESKSRLEFWFSA